MVSNNVSSLSQSHSLGRSLSGLLAQLRKVHLSVYEISLSVSNIIFYEVISDRK